MDPYQFVVYDRVRFLFPAIIVSHHVYTPVEWFGTSGG
jgi:hypothetical protein